VIIGLIVVPLMVLNMERQSDEEPWITRPFSALSGIVQRAYASFSSGVRGTTSLYLDLVGVQTKNRALQREIEEMRAQLGSMTELKVENERLNSLLGFRQSSPMELLAVKVVGRDLFPDHQTLTINRGTEHGIKSGMAALTVGGVIGYVFRTQRYSATVILLTDRYATIDALVQRSRARGLAEGDSKDGTVLRYLKRADDVRVGDLVVTSGMHGIFPKGFPIGKVRELRKSQYGMTQELSIDPAVETANLEEFFVVLNANQADHSVKPEVDEATASTEPKGQEKLGP
jgi:rod shape-determining protein MreC